MASLNQITDALRNYQDSSQGGSVDIITQSKYMEYVRAMKSLGEQPLSRDEWVAAGQPAGF